MKALFLLGRHLSAVLALGLSFAVSATIVSVDPDAFFTGTDISEAYPGVTLSVTGEQVDSGVSSPRMFSLVGVSATTGVNLFASSGSQGWTEDVLVFRVDFVKPAKTFSIDVIGRHGEVGIVRAFDDNGVEVGSYTTQPIRLAEFLPGAAYPFEVASIAPATENISYVLVYGTRESGSVRLDNINYEPVPELKINVTGGWQQECLETRGTTVGVEAELAIEGRSMAIVEWQVDGVTASYGNPASLFAPLGTHSITARATADSGDVFSATGMLTISDTTAPSLSLWLTDRRGRQVVNQLPPGLNAVTVHYAVSDTCDPNPTISALAGVAVSDGQEIRIHAAIDQVAIDASGFKVQAEAIDESGNTTTEGIVLLSK
jgi:hypothetical protein